jgi:hypothetical protein
MCDKCHKELEPAEYIDGHGIKWIRQVDGGYSNIVDYFIDGNGKTAFSCYQELRSWDLAETYDCR